MTDAQYEAKFQEMQKHIPFIQKVIEKLKVNNDLQGDNPRKAQLQKMEMLHELLTNRAKKLKMETLMKCEGVLTKLHAKIEKHSTFLQNEDPLPKSSNDTTKPKVSPVTTTTSSSSAPQQVKSKSSYKAIASAPASPSPERTVASDNVQPVVIPTERRDSPFEVVDKETRPSSVTDNTKDHKHRHHDSQRQRAPQQSHRPSHHARDSPEVSDTRKSKSDSRSTPPNLHHARSATSSSSSFYPLTHTPPLPPTNKHHAPSATSSSSNYYPLTHTPPLPPPNIHHTHSATSSSNSDYPLTYTPPLPPTSRSVAKDVHHDSSHKDHQNSHKKNVSLPSKSISPQIVQTVKVVITEPLPANIAKQHFPPHHQYRYQQNTPQQHSPIQREHQRFLHNIEILPPSLTPQAIARGCSPTDEPYNPDESWEKYNEEQKNAKNRALSSSTSTVFSRLGDKVVEEEAILLGNLPPNPSKPKTIRPPRPITPIPDVLKSPPLSATDINMLLIESGGEQFTSDISEIGTRRPKRPELTESKSSLDFVRRKFAQIAKINSPQRQSSPSSADVKVEEKTTSFTTANISPIPTERVALKYNPHPRTERLQSLSSNDGSECSQQSSTRVAASPNDPRLKLKINASPSSAHTLPHGVNVLPAINNSDPRLKKLSNESANKPFYVISPPPPIAGSVFGVRNDPRLSRQQQFQKQTAVTQQTPIRRMSISQSYTGSEQNWGPNATATSMQQQSPVRRTSISSQPYISPEENWDSEPENTEEINKVSIPKPSNVISPLPPAHVNPFAVRSDPRLSRQQQFQQQQQQKQQQLPTNTASARQQPPARRMSISQPNTTPEKNWDSNSTSTSMQKQSPIRVTNVSQPYISPEENWDSDPEENKQMHSEFNRQPTTSAERPAVVPPIHRPPSASAERPPIVQTVHRPATVGAERPAIIPTMHRQPTVGAERPPIVQPVHRQPTVGAERPTIIPPIYRQTSVSEERPAIIPPTQRQTSASAERPAIIPPIRRQSISQSRDIPTAATRDFHCLPNPRSEIPKAGPKIEMANVRNLSSACAPPYGMLNQQHPPTPYLPNTFAKHTAPLHTTPPLLPPSMPPSMAGTAGAQGSSHFNAVLNDNTERMKYFEAKQQKPFGPRTYKEHKEAKEECNRRALESQRKIEMKAGFIEAAKRKFLEEKAKKDQEHEKAKNKIEEHLTQLEEKRAGVIKQKEIKNKGDSTKNKDVEKNSGKIVAADSTLDKMYRTQNFNTQFPKTTLTFKIPKKKTEETKPPATVTVENQKKAAEKSLQSAPKSGIKSQEKTDKSESSKKPAGQKPNQSKTSANKSQVVLVEPPKVEESKKPKQQDNSDSIDVPVPTSTNTRDPRCKKKEECHKKEPSLTPRVEIKTKNATYEINETKNVEVNEEKPSTSHKSAKKENNIDCKFNATKSLDVFTTVSPEFKPQRILRRRCTMVAIGSAPLVDKDTLLKANALMLEDVEEREKLKRKKEEERQNARRNKHLIEMFQKTDDNCSVSTQNIITGKRSTRASINFNETQNALKVFRHLTIKDTTTTPSPATSTKSGKRIKSVKASGDITSSCENLSEKEGIDDNSENINKESHKEEIKTSEEANPLSKNVKVKVVKIKTEKVDSMKNENGDDNKDDNDDDKQSLKENAELTDSKKQEPALSAKQGKQPGKNKTKQAVKNGNKKASSLGANKKVADETKRQAEENKQEVIVDSKATAQEVRSTSKPELVSSIKPLEEEHQNCAVSSTSAEIPTDEQPSTSTAAQNLKGEIDDNEPTSTASKSSNSTPTPAEDETSRHVFLNEFVQEIIKPNADKQHILSLLSQILSEDKLQFIKTVIDSTSKKEDKDDGDGDVETEEKDKKGEISKENNDDTEKTERAENNVEESDAENEDVGRGDHDACPPSLKKPANSGRRTPIVKKKRNELDRLNEDIRDMFICEGVLTATGKRMCTLMQTTDKRDAEGHTLGNKITSSQSTSSASPPDIKPTVDVSVKRKVGRPKRPVSQPLRRSLRSLKTSETSLNESVNDDEVEVTMYNDLGEYNNSDTTPIRRKMPVLKPHTPIKLPEELDMLAIAAVGAGDSKLNKSTTKPGPKAKQIKAAKTEQQIDDLEASSGTQSDSDSDAVEEVAKVNRLRTVKNTNVHWHNQSKYTTWCALCDKKIVAISCSFHYKMHHGENFISRLTPIILQKYKQGKLSQPLFGVNRSPKQASWFHRCPFCLQYFNTPMPLWLEHFLNHTAEFRYECSKCHWGSNRNATTRRHFTNKCKDAKVINSTVKLVKPSEIKAHVCHLCNFIQLKRANLERHYVEQHHLAKKNVDILGYTITLFDSDEVKLVPEDKAQAKEDEMRREIELQERVIELEDEKEDDETDSPQQNKEENVNKYVKKETKENDTTSSEDLTEEAKKSDRDNAKETLTEHDTGNSEQVSDAEMPEDGQRPKEDGQTEITETKKQTITPIKLIKPQTSEVEISSANQSDDKSEKSVPEETIIPDSVVENEQKVEDDSSEKASKETGLSVVKKLNVTRAIEKAEESPDKKNSQLEEDKLIQLDKAAQAKSQDKQPLSTDSVQPIILKSTTIQKNADETTATGNDTEIKVLKKGVEMNQMEKLTATTPQKKWTAEKTHEETSQPQPESAELLTPQKGSLGKDTTTSAGTAAIPEPDKMKKLVISIKSLGDIYKQSALKMQQLNKIQQSTEVKDPLALDDAIKSVTDLHVVLPKSIKTISQATAPDKESNKVTPHSQATLESRETKKTETKSPEKSQPIKHASPTKQIHSHGSSHSHEGKPTMEVDTTKKCTIKENDKALVHEGNDTLVDGDTNVTENETISAVRNTLPTEEPKEASNANKLISIKTSGKILSPKFNAGLVTATYSRKKTCSVGKSPEFGIQQSEGSVSKQSSQSDEFKDDCLIVNADDSHRYLQDELLTLAAQVAEEEKQAIVSLTPEELLLNVENESKIPDFVEPESENKTKTTDDPMNTLIHSTNNTNTYNENVCPKTKLSDLISNSIDMLYQRNKRKSEDTERQTTTKKVCLDQQQAMLGTPNAFMSTTMFSGTDSPPIQILARSIVTIDSVETNDGEAIDKPLAISIADRLSQRFKMLQEKAKGLNNMSKSKEIDSANAEPISVEVPKLDNKNTTDAGDTSKIAVANKSLPAVDEVTVISDDEDWEDIEITESAPNPVPTNNMQKAKNKGLFQKFGLFKGSATKAKKNIAPIVFIPKKKPKDNKQPTAFSPITTKPCTSDKQNTTLASSSAAHLGFKPVINNIEDLLPDSPCNDPIDLVPELTPLEPLTDLNDISSILDSNLSLNVEESQTCIQDALDFISEQQAHEQQTQKPLTEEKAQVQTKFHKNKIQHVGYSLQSQVANSIKFYCLLENCSFLFSSDAVGLENHFLCEHSQIKWSGFCDMCQTQCKDNDKEYSIINEIKHMVDCHVNGPSLMVETNSNDSSQHSTTAVTQAAEERPRIKLRRMTGDCLSTSNSESSTPSGGTLAAVAPAVAVASPALTVAGASLSNTLLGALLNAKQKPPTKDMPPQPEMPLTEPLLMDNNPSQSVFTNFSSDLHITSVCSTADSSIGVAPKENSLQIMSVVSLNKAAEEPISTAVPTKSTTLSAKKIGNLWSQQIAEEQQDLIEAAEESLEVSAILANARRPPIQIENSRSRDDSPGPVIISETVPVAQEKRGDFVITQTVSAQYDDQASAAVGFNISIEVPVNAPTTTTSTSASSIEARSQNNSPLITLTLPDSNNLPAISCSNDEDSRNSLSGFLTFHNSPADTNATTPPITSRMYICVAQGCKFTSRVPVAMSDHLRFHERRNFSNNRDYFDCAFCNFHADDVDDYMKHTDQYHIITKGNKSTAASTNDMDALPSTSLSRGNICDILSKKMETTTAQRNLEALREAQRTTLIKEKESEQEYLKKLKKTIEEMVGETGFSDDKLYRCVIKDCRTKLTEATFHNHIMYHISTLGISNPNNYVFKCPHCTAQYHRPAGIKAHIKNHARNRYFCYMCDVTSANPGQMMKHFSDKHWHTMNMYTKELIKSKISLSADGAEKIFESGYFVTYSSELSEAEVRKYGEKLILEWQRKKSGSKTHFKSSEIDLLPIQPIFQREVNCGECQYKTKVRTNMYRHLMMHKQNAQQPHTTQQSIVASVDPVNPVPCLNSSERFFDKMTNLASSSLIPSNSANAAASTTSKPAYKLPYSFVSDENRYKCGVPNCNYVTVSDDIFRSHLALIHNAAMIFRCPFCQEEICKRGVSVERVINHLRFHSGVLYRCEECNYTHYLRFVVERHINDRHATVKVNIVKHERTSEVGEGTMTMTSFAGKKYKDPSESSQQQQPASASTSSAANNTDVTAKSSTSSASAITKSKAKWICDLCNTTANSLNLIQIHCQNIHGQSKPYQCIHCSFGSQQLSNILFHIDEKHSGKTREARYVYHKSINSNEIDVADTRPLWQRNDPTRVRHIRGILMEDEEESEKYRKKMGLDKVDDDDEDEEDLTQSTGNESNLSNFLKGYEFGCSHCDYKTQEFEELSSVHHKETHNALQETSKPFMFRLLRRVCCPECRKFIGNFYELQLHLLNTHNVRNYYAADLSVAEYDDSSQRLVCGYCPYHCLRTDQLIKHFQNPKVQHSPQDVRIENDLQIMDILEMGTKQTYYRCTLCTELLPNRVAIVHHATNCHDNEEGFSFRELNNALIYHCALCSYTATSEPVLLRHMIDHYGRFKRCHFCHGAQVSFEGYMQHCYAEHREDIRKFRELYQLKEIRKFLLQMFILFPNGLLISKRNLLHTISYGIENAITEFYEEIYRISQQPPIPRLSIARLVARKSIETYHRQASMGSPQYSEVNYDDNTCANVSPSPASTLPMQAKKISKRRCTVAIGEDEESERHTAAKNRKNSSNNKKIKSLSIADHDSSSNQSSEFNVPLAHAVRIKKRRRTLASDSNDLTQSSSTPPESGDEAKNKDKRRKTDDCFSNDKKTNVEYYSYYGVKPEAIDLSKVYTKVAIGGINTPLSIDKFRHLFNIDCQLRLTKCDVSNMPSYTQYKHIKKACPASHKIRYS